MFSQVFINICNLKRNGLSRFDPEGSGSIPAEEIRFIMKNLPVPVTDEEVDQMIRAVDKNRDGQICFNEFKKMYEQ